MSEPTITHDAIVRAIMREVNVHPNLDDAAEMCSTEAVEVPSTAESRMHEAEALFSRLRDSIANRCGEAGRVAVLLSAGLDSTVVLLAAVAAKRAGRVEDVVAIHYSWDLPGLRGELAYTQALCAEQGVPLHVLDFTALRLEQIAEEYEQFSELTPQSFQYHVTRAVALARTLGVSHVLTGCGAELICGDRSVHNVIKQRKMTEYTTGLADLDFFPEWLRMPKTRRAPAHPRGSTPRLARAFLYASVGQSAFTLLREERLLAESIGPGIPEMHHPFLDSSIVARSLTYPPFFHTVRFGGALFDKTLLRIILRRSTVAVWSRLRSGVLAAAEQQLLFNSRDFVASALLDDSHLTRRHIVKKRALENTINDPFSLRTDSTTIMAALLIEVQLRAQAEEKRPRGRLVEERI